MNGSRSRSRDWQLRLQCRSDAASTFHKNSTGAIMNRRRFLQSATALTAVAGVTHLGGWISGAEPDAKGAPNAEKLGWRLGCQAWSFNETTFYEAVDRTASLGLHFIEAFPGQ